MREGSNGIARVKLTYSYYIRLPRGLQNKNPGILQNVCCSLQRSFIFIIILAIYLQHCETQQPCEVDTYAHFQMQAQKNGGSFWLLHLLQSTDSFL